MADFEITLAPGVCDDPEPELTAHLREQMAAMRAGRRVLTRAAIDVQVYAALDAVAPQDRTPELMAATVEAAETQVRATIVAQGTERSPDRAGARVAEILAAARAAAERHVRVATRLHVSERRKPVRTIVRVPRRTRNARSQRRVGCPKPKSVGGDSGDDGPPSDPDRPASELVEVRS